MTISSRRGFVNDRIQANRPIILTRYEDVSQQRLPNGRLRQRLPPVRYANEPQTLGLLGLDAQPIYRKKDHQRLR
ncbi:hypothetical protein [Chamaesiphon sp.]|uniref:hypothetical protein n=1 Tax=Chamaesiphon sp. TaxID=2814140 RepID=UPI003593E7D5